MVFTPSHAFRCIIPADDNAQFDRLDRSGALLRETLETTDLVAFAQQLWRTPHNRMHFLLELPASKRWLSTTLTAEYAAGTPVTLVEGEIAELPARLTPRELEVLTLVAAGHSNPTIADALFTSPRTVSTQIESVRGKLGADNRTAAGVLAVQNGWLRMPMPVHPDLLNSLDIADLLRRPASASSETRPAGESPTPRRPLPIRIGLAYPSEGLAKDDGTQSRKGALLAIEQLNAKGGIRGRPLVPVLVDADIYSQDGVHQTFSTLRDYEVHAVLMSYVFDEATAFIEAARLGIPVLHTMTSTRHLETLRSDPERFRTLFQCAPPERNYGLGLIRFLDIFGDADSAELLPRTVRFLETTADSGQIADAETLRLLRSRGWEATGIDALGTSEAAIAQLAAGIIADPPTVLVVTEFLPSVLASLLLKLHAANCPSVIYTIYAPSVPEFAAEMGTAAEGLVWATVSGTYSDPYGTEFREAFTGAYGMAPGLSQAGLAYDMTHLIAAAWQQAADPSDVDGTLSALRATRYRGVNGSYSFVSGLQTTVSYPEETNDPSIGNAQLIFQVQDGEHRCIAPEPYAEARFRLPIR